MSHVMCWERAGGVSVRKCSCAIGHDHDKSEATEVRSSEQVPDEHSGLKQASSKPLDHEAELSKALDKILQQAADVVAVGVVTDMWAKVDTKAQLLALIANERREARIDEQSHTAVVKFKETSGNWYEGVGYEKLGEVPETARFVFTQEERLKELKSEGK